MQLPLGLDVLHDLIEFPLVARGLLELASEVVTLGADAREFVLELGGGRSLAVVGGGLGVPRGPPQRGGVLLLKPLDQVLRRVGRRRRVARVVGGQ